MIDQRKKRLIYVMCIAIGVLVGTIGAFAHYDLPAWITIPAGALGGVFWGFFMALGLLVFFGWYMRRHQAGQRAD